MKRVAGVFILITLFLILCRANVCSQTDNFKIPDFKNYQNSASQFTATHSSGGLNMDEDSGSPFTKERAGTGRNWNWIIYALILSTALYIIRRYELSRLKMKNQMAVARFDAEKYKDINELKSKFYANISHEFRTPLTLIKGPLEQLMKENADPEKKRTYKMMHRNTSRLLTLINQLLDLSKIENGNYALRARQGDVVGFIKGLVMSFTSIAEQRGIALKTIVDPKLQDCEIATSFYYDPDILDKIINNLLSNALKYTPKKGVVTTAMHMIEKNDTIQFLEICIEDTGIGIDPEFLPHIFDRFFQVDHAQKSDYKGTGVGLSIVHELILVHKGEIEVDSTPGKGTTFRIRIPAGNDHLLPHEIDSRGSLVISDPAPSQSGIPIEVMNPASEKKNNNIEQPWVLVVEDHKEVRRYIVDRIQNDYRILQAANAKDGYQMAQEFIPDLIVSDVMMPGISGFKFCELIKHNEKTSHIPIIILTARGDIHDRINGLKGGADDYLTKPFNTEELRIRIGNLIENRNMLRQKFSSNSIIKPEEISVSSNDAKFIELLLGLVEKNINNIYYSVDDFGRDAGLSQSQLNRKLKAIINISANQFIRSVRMHRAMELLKKDAGNIAEIAYMVGYDNPGYFTKTFHKFFDKLPSEITKT